jgi:hypothetical protein
MQDRRTVSLRAERSGGGQRFLSARLDDEGRLRIEGQDLGPATLPVSSDGEYEWVHTFQPHDLPALLALLDAPPDADILDELEQHWTGAASHELERRIREGAVPHTTSTWSG